MLGRAEPLYDTGVVSGPSCQSVRQHDWLWQKMRGSRRSLGPGRGAGVAGAHRDRQVPASSALADRACQNETPGKSRCSPRRGRLGLARLAGGMQAQAISRPRQPGTWVAEDTSLRSRRSR